MDAVLLSVLFTLAGVYIGRLSVLMRPRKDMEPGTIKGDFEQMAHQIVAFNVLEDLYAKEIANARSKPEADVRESFRQKVAAEGYKKPEMSVVEARRLLKTHVD